MKTSTKLTSIVPTMREINIFFKNIPMEEKGIISSCLVYKPTQKYYFFKLCKCCNEIEKKVRKLNVEINVLVGISRVFAFINNCVKI